MSDQLQWFDDPDSGQLRSTAAGTVASTSRYLEKLAGDSERLSSVDPKSELALALGQMHSTHLASLLRAVLHECSSNRTIDGRIPEWAREPQYVPFV